MQEESYDVGSHCLCKNDQKWNYNFLPESTKLVNEELIWFLHAYYTIG